MRRLTSKITVWNYLLLTFPTWIIALILRHVIHSDTPYYVWAALWGLPFVSMFIARWLYFVATLIAAIAAAIFHAVMRLVRPR